MNSILLIRLLVFNISTDGESITQNFMQTKNPTGRRKESFGRRRRRLRRDSSPFDVEFSSEQQTPRTQETLGHHRRPPSAHEHLQLEGRQDLRILLSRLLNTILPDQNKSKCTCNIQSFSLR